MHSTIHNIVSIFEEAVSNDPDKIALIEGRRRLTYTALNAKVRNASIRYQALGIEKGTKVLVLIPVSIDLYINILALIKIGASIIFVDEWSKKERLEACIKTVGIDVLVSGWKGKILRYFHPSLRQIPRSIVYQDVLSPNSVKEVSIEGKDSALVTYTTGSTGSPKAANRTHRFLYAQFIELKKTLQHNEIEVLITTLPIIVLLGLGLNKTVVLPRYNYKSAADSDFDALGMDLIQHQVDTFITSPFILDELVKTESSYKGLRSIYVGGAAIFKENPKVFTFSMHGGHNYPFFKEQSDRDVPLEKGTEDARYLYLLEKNLSEILTEFSPDFILYQSGVDVIESDKLGQLSLTLKGCKQRDRIVLSTAKELDIPIVAAMGGSYSPDIKDIIEAHANTYRLAQEIFF